MMQQTTTMPGALVTTAPGPIYTSSQGQVLTTGGPMVTTTSGMGYQAGGTTVMKSENAPFASSTTNQHGAVVRSVVSGQMTNAPGSTSITRNVEQYSTTSGQPIVPHQGYNTMGPSGYLPENFFFQYNLV
eukprot:Trichotokara_eunicae@DN4197_c0_g1_i4.p1